MLHTKHSARLCGLIKQFTDKELSNYHCIRQVRISVAVNGTGSAADDVEGVLGAYEQLIASQQLKPDASQRKAAQTLQLLQDVIRKPVPHLSLGLTTLGPRTAQVASEASASPAAADTRIIRGAYIHGPVGSGKTMLMNMFLSSLGPYRQEDAPESDGMPQASPSTTSAPAAALSNPQAQEGGGHQMQASKQPNPLVGKPVPVLRQHFHEFMLQLHTRMHEMQQALPKIVTKSRDGLPVYRYAEPPEHPLDACAREVAQRAHVLCLDELHVTNVSDAMILPRLFQRLLDHGVYVVFTSNRPPRDLYKGGLSFHYFEPFIRLAASLVVVKVASGVDYRQQAQSQALEQGAAAAGAQGAWYAGSDAEARMQQAWVQLSGGAADGERMVSSSYGRALWVPRAAGEAGWFTFEQLCGEAGLQRDAKSPRPLAAPDYLALCRALPIVCVSDVPPLGPKQRDAARRWVTFLDVAYESGITLICSAQTDLDGLFARLLHAAEVQGVDVNLGRAKPVRASGKQPVAGPASGGVCAPGSSVKARSLDSAGSRGRGAWRGGTVEQDDDEEEDPAPVRLLLAEEVLMYHRAQSRLNEMCNVFA